MHAPIVVGRFPATWPGEKSPYLMGKWYKIHTHKLIHVWRILPPGTVFFPHCHAITSSLTQLIAAVPAVPLDPCHHRSAGRSLAPGVAGHGVLEGAQGQLFQVEERSQELDVLSTVPGRFQPKKRGWSVCWKMRFFPYFLGQIWKCWYSMYLYHGTLGNGTIISVWCWVAPSPPVIPNPNLGCSSGMV